jgi:predicted secreted protein
MFFMGCSGPYTYSDNGSTIELSEDDPFQIVLKGDNNTNFNWRIDSSPEFVALQKTENVKDKGGEKDFIFNFKTISDGKDTIKLVYTDGVETKQTFKITVIVGTIGLITSE